MHGQKRDALIKGRITDSTGKPISDIRIKVDGQNESALSNGDGRFSLKVPSGKALTVDFLYLNLSQKAVRLQPLNATQDFEFPPITLSVKMGFSDIIITDSSSKKQGAMQRVNPHNYDYIPNVSGGIEGIVKNFAGVSSNNEMSSQYSVRGGNYDENLVYINDIEIYRPQLVRAGQEEGLSIANTDMVQSLDFSAGGFEARYGDKLSSVLDIHYKNPDTFALKTNLSLLGASGEVEGTSKDHRLQYIAGVRYRNSQYLLSSLDVQGEYLPSFVDAQAYLTYHITDKLSLNYLTYYGSNTYLSIPQSQTTQFGTATNAVQLVVAFQGKQLLEYSTFLNGLTLDYQPDKNDDIKFINSFYTSAESEDYDIIGAYQLQQLDANLGDANFGKAINTFGYGEFLYHARDSFYAEIFSSEIKGTHNFSPTFDLLWGVKYQHEHIYSALNEYTYVDSVDYSVPQSGNPRKTLVLPAYVYSRVNADWNRYSAYAQGNFLLDKDYNSNLYIGLRANYWDFNHEMLISPRAQFSFEPNAPHNRRVLAGGMDDSLLKKRLILKAAAGIYSQPPFFKELFAPDGTLVPGIRAQKSSHILIGQDLTFNMWNRPFRFTTDLYYKYMWDLIPYTIDDVHIIYLGNNNATGYAGGVDFQLHGNLVNEEPSWISLSLLQTAEKINGGPDYTKFIPMPTDQRVRFSFFFQDYLPGHPTYKVHLNFVFGTGLPFGPPGLTPYKDTLRLPPYKRVDIGFSKMLWDKSKQHTNSKFIGTFKSIWLSLEVFNLLNINNTVSYLWVQDIDGNQWAVPSYLTTRRLNFALEMKF